VDLGILVGVGVADAKLIGEQPLVPGNSNVSQVTRKQREKNRKRDLDTMVDTSNRMIFMLCKKSWPDFLTTIIIAHLDKLGYFWYFFPIDFHRGCGMLKGDSGSRGARAAGAIAV